MVLTKGKLIAFLILALVISCGVYYYFFGYKHVAGYNPQAATKRWALNYANKQHVEAVVELNKQRNSIGDAAYARGLAHENAVLGYRTRIAENPEMEICNFGIDVTGNVRTWKIPSACDSGLKFTVWPDGPKKTIKAKLFSGDGDELAETPSFTAGRGSSVGSLGGDRWEFEGDVYYEHRAGVGKSRILRITVE